MGNQPNCQILSLIQIDESKFFSVYPNPASDIVSITFSLNETAPNSLKIINVLGQEIKRIVLTSSDEVSLKTSEIPHGLYFIQVRNGDNSMFVKKLMIR